MELGGVGVIHLNIYNAQSTLIRLIPSQGHQSGIFQRPTVGQTRIAYHLYGKPGNSGENSNETFIPVEIFRQKK